jgi:IclR family pca regulon transcriptional regulator
MTTEPLDHTEDPAFVTAFARGLSVIRAFDSGREKLTLAGVARVTGLSRATVRRSLITLVTLGYAQTDGRFFQLTPKVLSLGYAYLASTPLPRLIQPALEEVTAKTRESSSACILDGNEIVYIARSATRRVMSVGLSVGSRLPAYCTSMGRVLLAAEPVERRAAILGAAPLRRLTARTETSPAKLEQILDEVAARGYSLVDQELEMGLRSIAVPVHNSSGRVVAAINVGLHAGRSEPAAMLATILPHLREAAAALRPTLAG